MSTCCELSVLTSDQEECLKNFLEVKISRGIGNPGVNSLTEYKIEGRTHLSNSIAI